MPDQLRIEHLMILAMMCLLLRMGWQLNRRKVKRWWERVKDHLPVKRHPKSPKDCPHCCRGIHLESVQIKRDVTPWSAVKSKRGRKKQYPTQGWACLNPVWSKNYVHERNSPRS